MNDSDFPTQQRPKEIVLPQRSAITSRAPNAKKQEPIANKPLPELTYKRSKSQAISAAASSFGKDAPKIAIGSSRNSFFWSNTLPLPGPGAYNPINIDASRRILHKISKSTDKPRKIETADIDFINQRIFPIIRPQTISKTGHQDYYTYDSSIPGPRYNPQPIFSIKTHKILDRRPIKPMETVTPGPGAYDPKEIESSTPFRMSKSKVESGQTKENQIPGPGSYNPNFYAELSELPKWSIGKKARNRKRRKNEPPEVPKGKLIGVAQFLIQIDPSMEEEDVLKFVANHPELKMIVTDLMNKVLQEKPDDPIEWIKRYFAAQKAQKALKVH